MKLMCTYLLILVFNTACLKNSNISLNDFKNFDKHFSMMDSTYDNILKNKGVKSFALKFPASANLIKKEDLKILTKLDSNLSYLLSSNIIDTVLAIGKMKIQNNITAYLIHFKGEATCQETGVYLYCFKKNEIKNEIYLLGGFASEGFEQVTDSWVLDYNRDGKIDILRKTRTMSLTGNNADLVETKEYKLFVWMMDTFVETRIGDINLFIKEFEILDKTNY